MLGLLHRSTGRTARFMTFIANQLVGLFGIQIYSTSLHRRPVVWAARYWILLQPTGRIVRPFIVSDARGPPARLGTLRCYDSSCKRCHLSWRLLGQSDFATSRLSICLLAHYILPTPHVICAIKVLHAVHIKVLILGGTSGALISTSIAAT